MRNFLDMLCDVMHRLHWIPLLNRLPGWGCPVSWACHRFPGFDRWYWRES